LNKIIEECDFNKIKAEEYLHLHLSVHFPEIQSQMQTKKAAY